MSILSIINSILINEDRINFWLNENLRTPEIKIKEDIIKNNLLIII